MDSPVPDLAGQLQVTLDAFDAEGIQPTAAEIVWLANLRRKCDRRGDGGVTWAMGAPLRYGGETFYPLHRLAESWWRRANDLLAEVRDDQIKIYLYAHTKSAPHDASLRLLMIPDEIRTTIREWYDQTAIHDGQLNELVDRLRELNSDSDDVPDPYPKPKRKNETTTPDDAPEFVGMMCKAFPGVTPEFWLTDISAADARKMFSGVIHEGPWATHPERTAAIENYLRAVKWVWKNHGV